MGLFSRKKKGVVLYERPINYFLNDKNEMLFKGKDFHEFLVEYQKEFEKKGLTAENNDAAQLLKMFIENFKMFAGNENDNKDNLSN